MKLGPILKGSLVLALWSGFPLNSRADIDDCRGAISMYRDAASDVMDGIRGYAACIANSKGTDDCSGEFSTLQSAQSDFEEAVSNYQGDCD